MKLFPQETVLEIKTLLLMTDLAYCGYSYICMRRAFGEQYAFLFLLAIMVPRICQLSTRSIRCCCIFRAWVTVLRALLTLWAGAYFATVSFQKVSINGFTLSTLSINFHDCRQTFFLRHFFLST